MPTPSTMTDLSITAASNSPAGTESPTNGDDFLRAIQAIIRRTNAKGSDIASATTTDIGAATAEFVDITGTTTITGLGTIDAGIVRTVRFTGALTLTYNATSLILPGNANITTANGDMAMFRSLGSGNWVCVSYVKRDGTAISAPYLPLAGGTVTGATTFSADVTMSSATMKWVKGADVASATALPLITDGNYFDVTGTTTITSFNSMGVGTWIRLHFDAALTLAHNATDLVLPSGVNIITAANDEAEFIEYASGDWRCVSYTRASGLSLVGITSGTVVATTSGTSIDIGNGSNGVTFPSTIKRITLMFNVVSTSGTSVPIIQLGDSGGIENTGYTALGGAFSSAGATGVLSSTAGFPITNATTATDTYSGTVTFTLLDSANNTWTASGSLNKSGTTVASTQGVKSTSATLDRIRLTTVGGTDNFDAGSINVLYE